MNGNLSLTPPLRIASLLPAATEIVCALGARDRLAGVSHACDYPSDIAGLPALTATPVQASESSAAIEAQVRDLRAAGRPVIAVDGRSLAKLRPDLILAQDLCDVCAVTDGTVCSLAEALSPAPAVVSLGGRTVAGIFEDIRKVGAALGLAEAAAELVTTLHRRLDALPVPAKRPRVAVIEWLDPLYLAGHWVPDLVAHAGGLDVGALPGSPSVTTTWEHLASLRPDVIILALCGFGLQRAVEEWHAAAPPRVLPAPVVALDGNAYTSRPGPRVVDGAELIAMALRGETGAKVMRL